jgi:hypothetical protein
VGQKTATQQREWGSVASDVSLILPKPHASDAQPPPTRPNSGVRCNGQGPNCRGLPIDRCRQGFAFRVRGPKRCDIKKHTLRNYSGLVFAQCLKQDVSKTRDQGITWT